MKTHCVHGHALVEENIYVTKSGARHCKTCRRERMAERRAGGVGRGGHNATKTHCPRGHEYTDENTVWSKDRRRWCRTCATANRRVQNVKRYGITPERLEGISQEQGHACAICREAFGQARKRSVDHAHTCCPGGGSCGKCVRGLLCADCNQGLGRFHDDPALLRSAAEYVEKHHAESATL